MFTPEAIAVLWLPMPFVLAVFVFSYKFFLADFDGIFGKIVVSVIFGFMAWFAAALPIMGACGYLGWCKC